jgi:uncharacterized protein (UPF0332 family)
VTLDRDDKKNLSDIRMEKAREFLHDAENNLKEGRFRTSINRSYYSVMNGARSLLILEGLNPETHDGITTMLSLHFIKKGLLPVEIIKIYKTLLSRRTDVDYGDFDAIDSSETEDSAKSAAKALEMIDVLRKKMIGGG